jgi:hypothetical protein
MMAHFGPKHMQGYVKNYISYILCNKCWLCKYYIIIMLHGIYNIKLYDHILLQR